MQSLRFFPRSCNSLTVAADGSYNTRPSSGPSAGEQKREAKRACRGPRAQYLNRPCGRDAQAGRGVRAQYLLGQARDLAGATPRRLTEERGLNISEDRRAPSRAKPIAGEGAARSRLAATLAARTAPKHACHMQLRSCWMHAWATELQKGGRTGAAPPTESAAGHRGKRRVADASPALGNPELRTALKSERRRRQVGGLARPLCPQLPCRLREVLRIESKTGAQLRARLCDQRPLGEPAAFTAGGGLCAARQVGQAAAATSAIGGAGFKGIEDRRTRAARRCEEPLVRRARP